MNKRLTIEGMSCAHCTAFVEKTLNAMDGVAVKSVDLQGANIALTAPVSDDELIRAIDDAGYALVSIQDQ